MTEFQIPRNSLAWMLAAQAAVIAPHLPRLPAWIILVCVGCGFWRVMVYQGRWAYPGRFAKLTFVVLGIVGVGAGFDGFGLEPAVGLLIVAFMLKLLEMQRKRDAYVVILMAYFVALTEFLFQQTIPWTLYMLLVVTMITAALIGLNQTRSHLRPVKTFKTAGVLLCQSIPLMIVLFVLFPRLAPLWTVPLEAGTAKSGLGDNMRPGDIAQLAQSDELAFRVWFEGERPPVSRLYWRGLVLSRFDGRTWEQERPSAYGRIWIKGGRKPGWVGNMELLGQPVQYTVIQEPTYRNWLFSLTAPEAPPAQRIGLVRDFRFYSLDLVRARSSYELRSFLDYRLMPKGLNNAWRQRTTRLPDTGNERTRELAYDLYEASSGPRDYIDRVQKLFTEQEFVYTLRPGTLGDEYIDEFMFETQRGFCEHFASAFVFMMRAADIPARVVVGYQGGEYNPVGDYVAVYQFDAHAWAEVWLEGQGWVRVDPTSAVAPSRIERGLQAAVNEEESFLENQPLSWMRFQQLWLTELRLQISAMNLYWDAWVLGYTPEMQMSLLSRFVDDINLRKLGLIALAVFFTVLGIIAVFLLMKRSRPLLDRLDREYLAFCRLLERQGLGRHRGEGPVDFADRVTKARPELEASVRQVTDIYVEENYGTQQGDHRRLKRAVRNFRLKSLTAGL